MATTTAAGGLLKVLGATPSAPIVPQPTQPDGKQWLTPPAWYPATLPNLYYLNGGLFLDNSNKFLPTDPQMALILGYISITLTSNKGFPQMFCFTFVGGNGNTYASAVQLSLSPGGLLNALNVNPELTGFYLNQNADTAAASLVAAVAKYIPIVGGTLSAGITSETSNAGAIVAATPELQNYYALLISQVPSLAPNQPSPDGGVAVAALPWNILLIAAAIIITALIVVKKIKE